MVKKEKKQRGSKRTEKEQKQPSVHRRYSESKEYSSIAAVTDDEIQTERKQAYIERPTQNLLRNLLKTGKNEEILPSYDPASGFIYKTIEPAFEEEISHEKAAEFLERLTRLDILTKSFFDTVSTCPQCESTTMTLHYHCPKCNSHNIVKTSLTEHIPCGLITEREKFTYGKCPRCGDLLINNQYRDMGRWYVCRECNEKFEHPQLEIICRRCNRNFTIEESKVLEIPKYSLNTKRKNEIRQNVASLASITKVLQDLKFQVEIPGIAIGQKSGMQHRFSILARKNIQDQETVVAVDHAVGESEVQSSPLILYIHKTSELKVDIPIFLAIPKLSETAKKIAQGYQILLIEGSPESQEAIDQIRREIELRLTQKTSQLQPEAPISAYQQQEKKGDQNTKGDKSEIKPRLFSTISSIHQSQERTKTKKPNRFIGTLKKAIKRNKAL
jgi:ssDNA-binding Zn-finger/Zn-ribbon topoisomerase 1